MEAPTNITRILNSPEERAENSSELLGLVYDQLRKIAQQRMNEERHDHTLTATALVHEAYLRLVGGVPVDWDGRGHFYTACAEAMRRILIEHARLRGRVKRGGDDQGRPARRVPLNVVDLAQAEDPEEIVAVEAAVCRLEERDPDLGRLVRLRFYAGLSVPEVAMALGLSERTVQREWVLARAWLHDELGHRD